jgi:hypothetical protein
VKTPNDNIWAAWRLFLRDPNALSAFDGSAEEALHSFRALFTALPFYLFLLLLAPESLNSTRSGLDIGLLHAVFYVLIWTMWPVVMLRVVRVVDRQEHYFRYLAAYNWSMLIQATIWLAVFIVTWAFGLTGSPARIITVVAVCTVVLYHIHILRSTLELRKMPALTIAMIKMFLYQLLMGTHHAALIQPSGS